MVASNPYSAMGLSTRIRLRTAADGAHLASKPSSSASSTG